MPASPMGVGRAQPESNRRFPAVRQGVLPTELCARRRAEGGDPPPDEVGRSTFSPSRPNHATGWFDPATPLPDAEVSFLMGEVVHQAGMEQRSGFEPPLPAWKAGVLTVEH